MSTLTLVTGLWNIGRGGLNEGWSRSYQHYLDKFDELLRVDVNLIIYGDLELRKFVFERRSESNTFFIERSLSWFKENEYFDKIQSIRNSNEWQSLAGWLPDSTQGKLEFYNPIVMSKMFLLNDAKILDPFNSQFLFWIDAGITNTVHPGYFTHDKVLDKLPNLVDSFAFICFPYEADREIHGFDFSEIKRYAGTHVGKVARGGFFGGRKELFSEVNSIYYTTMISSLNENLMGTEESIFSIMVYKYPNLFKCATIDGNGLISKFFEDVKNDVARLTPLVEFKKPAINKKNVSLYVISFNSPNQFETLISSLEKYDANFLDRTKKYLLDNSTDLTTTPRYLELCEKYQFEHIKKDNIGIVGGRVFIAEHFHESDSDLMYFFEDDMFFYLGEGKCTNGFERKIDNIFIKTIEICVEDDLDFLKLNFTEFYGDNGTQWSWYNVPQSFREKHWPNNKVLPVSGLDPNAPRTKFDYIKSYRGLPYAVGEVYLCNWPILMTKTGNYKCYIETKFQYPHEQTLMSHVYQETIKGRIKSGVLLATPTEHNRFDHYPSNLRKEC